MQQNANNFYGTIFAPKLLKRPPIKYSSGAVEVRKQKINPSSVPGDSDVWE